MSYRFLKLTSVYPDFEKDFIRANPNRADLTYKELLSRLISSRYGLSDFYSRYMKRLGNEAEEGFVSIEVLQKLWARERLVAFQESNWVQDIAAAQVAAFRPDILFLQDLYLFDDVFRARLRAVAPPHALLVGWRSSPTEDFGAFRDLDLVLSAFPHFVERWKSLGINAHLLPLAFDPAVLSEVAPTDRTLDLTFVGQIGSVPGPHTTRKRLLDELVRSTPLEVWGGPSRPRRSLRARIGEFRRDRSLKILFERESQAGRSPRFHPPVFGLEYYRVLGGSKISLNHHSEVTGPHASNVRMYEATGMGACLLNDQKDDLGSYFEVDREVVAYANAAECAEKARYLLENDRVRESIAEAGQARTLASHTWERRVEELNEILETMLSRHKSG